MLTLHFITVYLKIKNPFDRNEENFIDFLKL